MNAGEIRAMADAAIINGIQDKKKKLLEVKCAAAVGNEADPAQIKILRREIARMKTILNEKNKAAVGGNK